MYTSVKTPLRRLRAYHRELTDLYNAAVKAHHYARAQELSALRWRVWRAIRIREEWGDQWETQAVPEFLRHAPQ